MNDKESAAAGDFAMEHYKLHGKTAEVTVHAIQTGIGWSLTVQCIHCRKKKDISDTDNW